MVLLYRENYTHLVLGEFAGDVCGATCNPSHHVTSVSYVRLKRSLPGVVRAGESLAAAARAVDVASDDRIRLAEGSTYPKDYYHSICGGTTQ